MPLKRRRNLAVDFYPIGNPNVSICYSGTAASNGARHDARVVESDVLDVLRVPPDKARFMRAPVALPRRQIGVSLPINPSVAVRATYCADTESILARPSARVILVQYGAELVVDLARLVAIVFWVE